MTHSDPTRIKDDVLQMDSLSTALFKPCWIAGLVSLGASLAYGLVLGEAGLKHFFYSYLLNFCFFLSLSLGALFFVLLHHVTRSGWSVVVRRVAEVIAANLPLLAVLFIPILFGLGSLYPWTDAAHVEHDPMLQAKSGYLNVPFFIVRCVIYFGIWSWLSNTLLLRSVEQDGNRDPGITVTLERLSAPGMLLFALTASFASFDLLMSLDPHWFSTIMGVYFFAGSGACFFSAFCLVLVYLQKTGRLVHAVSGEHYHDIGKWVFAFVFFWAYIAFSQYMLIWYANLPEETGWVYRRTTGAWGCVSLVLLFGHFIIPFLGLLSRHPKRNKRVLAAWSVWILIMHWVDLYWLIMPELSPDRIPIHLLDVSCFVGLGGLFVAGVVHRAGAQLLIPNGDPRLDESLTFENA